MERLGHKIVTKATARQRAFDAFDDGGGVTTDAVETVGYFANTNLEFGGLGPIAA